MICPLPVVALLLLLAPFTSAQSTTTTTTDNDDDPSSLLRPLPSSIPSLSIPSIPSLLTLPPLNLTHSLLSLTLPSLPATYITFNLCSLPSGWNGSSPGIPTVLVSRDDSDADSSSSSATQQGNTERDGVERWTFAKAGSGSRDLKSGGEGVGGNRKSRARDGRGEVWRVVWDKGFGNWTYGDEEGAVGFSGSGPEVKVLLGIGLQTDGTVRAVQAEAEGEGEGEGEGGNVVIQIGISSTGPLHTVDPNTPFISDTTSSTALIFSPLLGPVYPLAQPRYPNYTIPALPLIPPLNTSSSSFSSSSLNLIIVPTTSSPTLTALDNSQCAAHLASDTTGNLGNAQNMVLNRTEPSWMRIGKDGPGYRAAWAVGGLESGTNYTVWVEGDGWMSAPAWFGTKSAGFSCPLLLPTPECPGISYAAPLPLPDPDTDTDASTSPNSQVVSTLPNTTLSLLSTNLASFRTSLLSQACGRDVFSHVSTCLDCHEAYRDWLCHMLVPRCADPSSLTPSPSPSTSTSNDTAPLSNIYDDAQTNIPQSIIPRTPTPYTSSLGIQSLGLSPAVETAGMAELAPCLAICHAVERQCPAFLKFRCPHYSNGAQRRYGFHGERSAQGNGGWETGWAGMDRWGGAWCAL